VGVASSSSQATLKKKGFLKRLESFEDKERYSEWVFAVKVQP